MKEPAQAPCFSPAACDKDIQLTALPNRVETPPASHWETSGLEASGGTSACSVQDVSLASATVVIDVFAPGPVPQGAPLPASRVDSEVVRAVEAVTHMVETMMTNIRGMEAAAKQSNPGGRDEPEAAQASALALQLASVAVAQLQPRAADDTEAAAPLQKRLTAALASTADPQPRARGQRTGRRGLFAWLFQRGKELLQQFGQLRIHYEGDNPYTKGLLRVAEGALALAIVLVGLI